MGSNEAHRVRFLYGSAQQAMRDGNGAKAYALLEQVLPLLEAAGEQGSRHVVLGQMGRLLVEAQSPLRAIEVWTEAIQLAEAQSDLQGASLLADRVAALHANQGAWRRALEHWEHALELDTRLGQAHNRAVSLANVAAAAAQVGDKLRADRCWSEALDVFEASSATAQAIAIGNAMHGVATRSHDFSDPLELRARILRLAEAGNDAFGQVLALEGMAHAAEQRRLWAEACAHWERACAVAGALGDPGAPGRLRENLLRCRAEMLGETWVPVLPKVRRHYPSVSELALLPDAGPAFLVGELWATLHARGISLRALKPGDVTISQAGVTRIAPHVALEAGTPFEPEAAARDLSAALDGRAHEQASGLLAGYARRGYEAIDFARPGFTDAVLDHFEVPRPRLGTLQAVDPAAMLAALGAELRVDQGQLTLTLLETSRPAPVWQSGPERAFVFVLSLLVLGVDCRALWARDAGTWPAFELLLPRAENPPDPEAAMARRLALVPTGLEMAAALAQVVRGMPGAIEPLRLEPTLPWVRKVLTKGSGQQAAELSDTLLESALHCSQLLERHGDPALASFLQKASIFFEYMARGEPFDELRLVKLTRALYTLPEIYPPPLEPWPQEFGGWLWQWNSLLLAFRELANHTVAAQERGQVGALRSAALRGVCAARHVLRVSYASAHSRDPEVATSSLLLLRVTIKNYANLMLAFVMSVQLEHQATGKSAWLPWIESPTGPTHVSRELSWSAALLEAAAAEGFSLESVRPLMRAGAEFYTEENACFVLSSKPSPRPLN